MVWRAMRADLTAKNALKLKYEEIMKVPFGKGEAKSLIKTKVRESWQKKWDIDNKGWHYYNIQKSIHVKTFKEKCRREEVQSTWKPEVAHPRTVGGGMHLNKLVASFQAQSKVRSFFAEMLHVCMAYVWIDAKSLRRCICMHFRRTLYWWGHHIMVQSEYGFKVLFDVGP